MNKKILIRTNGGLSIGLGHISRTRSLARAIKESYSEVEIIFIINKESTLHIEEFTKIISLNFDKNDLDIIKKQRPDLIIFDSYLANNIYLQELAIIAPLIIFDDNNDIYKDIPTSFVINGNIYAEELDYDLKGIKGVKLLGPKYLVMRPEYWNSRPFEPKQDNSLLITTGAADPGEIMIKFVEALKNISLHKYLIIGPYFSEKEIIEINDKKDGNITLLKNQTSLLPHFLNSKYILCAAGSSVYEILRLRRIPIIFLLVENQALIEKKLVEFGVLSLGKADSIDWVNIQDKINFYIENIASDPNLDRLFEIITGDGAFLVAEKIMNSLTR